MAIPKPHPKDQLLVGFLHLLALEDPEASGLEASEVGSAAAAAAAAIVAVGSEEASAVATGDTAVEEVE